MTAIIGRPPPRGYVSAMRHSIVDDPPRRLRSAEGVPWRDYRPLETVAALPVGLGITGAFALLARHVVAEPVDVSELPRDAIIYCYHHESLLVMLSPNVWHGFGPELVYLGYHGFASYTGGVWPYLNGFQAFRYERRRQARPLEQIVQFLRANPHLRLAMRTDAGGPYGRVRVSLVDMALKTGRPLVGLRQLVDRSVKIMRHVVPLPGALVRSRLTRAVHPDELRALSRDAARDLLQREIDTLE